MIRKLENEIYNEKNKLLNHVFFRYLTNGYYKKEKLHIFAEQYYLLSSEFSNLLFYACLKIKSEKTRLPIVKNLWDEHGQGDLKLSHRSLLKKFLIATNSNINNIIPLNSTALYI